MLASARNYNARTGETHVRNASAIASVETFPKCEAAVQPLYATCHYCGQTVQCYSHDEVKLGPHNDKKLSGENCRGSDEIARSPRLQR